jgi:hypothetical protein
MKVKVKITKNVHSFMYEGKRYLPGDIAEIDPAYLKTDFMELIPEDNLAIEVKKEEEGAEKSESSIESEK